MTHLHDLARKKGDYASILMRKHIAWYVRGLYDNSTLCREINHAKTPAETEALLWSYLEKLESAPTPYAPVLDAADADVGGEDGDANGTATELNGSCASP